MSIFSAYGAESAGPVCPEAYKAIAVRKVPERIIPRFLFLTNIAENAEAVQKGRQKTKVCEKYGLNKSRLQRAAAVPADLLDKGLQPGR